MELVLGLLSSAIYDSLKKGVTFIEPTFRGFLVETIEELSHRHVGIGNSNIRDFFFSDEISNQIKNYKEKGLEPEYEKLIKEFQIVCNEIGLTNAKEILDDLFKLIEEKLVKNPIVYEKIKMHYLQNISQNLESGLDQLVKLNEKFRTLDKNFINFSEEMLQQVKGLQKNKIKQHKIEKNLPTTFEIKVAKLLSQEYERCGVKIQSEIFELSKKNEKFAHALGAHLGGNFFSYSKEIKEKLWSELYQNKTILAWFGFSLGYDFHKFSHNQKLEIYSLSKNKIILHFISIILVQKMLWGKQSSNKLLEGIKENEDLKLDFAYVLSKYFPKLKTKTRNIVWNFVKQDDFSAVVFGAALTRKFKKFKPHLRKEIWKNASKIRGISGGLGASFGDTKILPFGNKLWDEIMNNASINKNFGYSLGGNMARYLPTYSPYERKMFWRHVQKNVNVSFGFVLLLTHFFSSYNSELKSQIFKNIDKSNNLKKIISINRKN